MQSTQILREKNYIALYAKLLYTFKKWTNTSKRNYSFPESQSYFVTPTILKQKTSEDIQTFIWNLILYFHISSIARFVGKDEWKKENHILD